MVILFHMNAIDADRQTGIAAPAIPHRSAIIWLFVAAVLAQPVQYVVISRLGEPYPALTMPQFAGTMTDSIGRVTTRAVEAVVAFDDASVETVSMGSLLAQAPVSHRPAIARFVFGVRDTVARTTPPEPTGLKQRLKRALLPGLVAKYRLLEQPTADPRTVQWLGQRLHALYPSKRPIRASFHWYDDAYQLGAQSPERFRNLIGTYDVDLGNAK